MTSQINIGVSNNKKTVKDFYIGVDNKPRKVLKGWIGVDNKPRLFYNFSGLPQNFIEAEWILNDDPSNQYINTGVLCDSNTRVVLDIGFHKLQTGIYICGVRDTYIEKNYIFPNYVLRCRNYGNGYSLYYGNTDTLTTYFEKTAYTSGHTIIDLNNNGNFIIDGDIFYTSNEKYTNNYINNPNNYNFDPPYLSLYATTVKDNNNNITYQTDNGISQFKLYGCQIYQNNKLIRNFIPCHYTKNDVDAYNHGYLYDTVNKQIYSNGNFPDGDVFLSSIEGE